MNDTGQHVVGRGRSLAGQILRIVQTRLEILSVEIQREKLSLTSQLRLAAIAAICAWLAGLALLLWVALVLPPNVRSIVLGALFVLLLLASLVSWIVLRRRAARRDPLFARVIHQLRLDRASLSREP